MIIGVIPGVAVPALIGLVGKETKDDWTILFLISTGVILLTVGFYTLVIKPNIQEFDKPALAAIREIQEFEEERDTENVSEAGSEVTLVENSSSDEEPDDFDADCFLNWPDAKEPLTITWTDDAAKLNEACEEIKKKLSENNEEIV